MKRIAKFHKVSYEQFKNAYTHIEEVEVNKMYEAIRLPQRATAKSAGYDFYIPFDCTIKPNQTIKIATGIRVEMQPEYVLQLYPRSGLGFKYRIQLNNTVGIIDADYFESDNEGHIFAKLTNATNTNETLHLEAGDAFMQGIFMEYGITIDDDVQTLRNGGFGSTSKGKK